MRRSCLLWICLFLTIAGCAASTSSKSSPLLEQDYLLMSDKALVTYEQQVNDELMQATRTSSPGMSLGLGLFSWGGSGGVGLNTNTPVGGSGGDDAIALRNRRDAVRAEMRQRGLIQ